MDLPEIDPAVRATFPSYCFDHAREDCPFEDPNTPIYRATNLDRDGKLKPFRPYRDELADRRWLTSTGDEVRTMIEIVSPYANRFDRASGVVEFVLRDGRGGMRFEAVRGDGAALRPAITMPTASLLGPEPRRRSPRLQAR